MKDMFLEIYEKETNENTALILMLSVINQNLLKIQDLLKKVDKRSLELSPEDYME